MLRFFREDNINGTVKEISHDEAIALLSNHYTEAVCSYESMLSQNAGYTIPCGYSTLRITQEMSDLIGQIKAILEESSRMKNAYFFNSPSNASGRRAYEKKHSHPVVEWHEGGHAYTAEYTVSCSCHNVYAKGHYTKDGKPTNITAVRNSLARLEKEFPLT